MHSCSRILLITPLLCLHLFAGDTVGFGIKGGIPLTSFFAVVNPGGPFRFDAATRRYTLGPAFELRLPGGLGVEVDLLYKRVGYESQLTGPGGVTISSARGASWQFPLLGKYRFPGILIRPYVEGGICFDRFTGLTHIAGLTQEDSSRSGWVIGAGLEIKAPVARLTPEMRFTRWGSDPISSGSGITSTLTTTRNQAEFLLGIIF